MSALIRQILQTCLLSIFVVSGALAGEGEGEGEGGGEKAGLAGEYMELKPAFITNYGGAGAVHFLKAEITLRMSKEIDANELVMHHMPQLRHELIMLFSKQPEENLQTMQGKEQLRLEALAAVQKVINAEEGKKLVEDLLFTNFVIQH